MMKMTRPIKQILEICSQFSVSIAPRAGTKLSVSSQMSIAIPPYHPQLALSMPTVMDICPSPPKPNYHPYVIEAMKLMYAKAPDELSEDEFEQFWAYYDWKKSKGEPIEEDFVYKPRAS